MSTQITFDGHTYIDHGDHVTDADGNLVCTVNVIEGGETVIAECPDGVFARIHENEPDARLTAIKAAIVGQY